jgi:diguanylate cyclase (GGDEF)-like protein
MLKLIQRLTGQNSAVALLVAAAIGAVLFTAVAGEFVYSNTRQLISAADWAQHTQDVISGLQRAALLSERIEYRTRIYSLTRDDDQLNLARQSANLLATNNVRLSALVSDNPAQIENLRELSACTAGLAQILDKFTPATAVPEIEVQRCERTISLMNDREQALLKDRNAGKQHSSFVSIGTQIGFEALALVTLVVLFGFLLRDAVMRQRTGRETAATNQQLALTVNALEDRAHESRLMTEARDELQLCVEVHQVYQSAANSFGRLLEGTSGSLCMINNSRQLVEVVSSWNGEGETSAVVDFNPPESCCGLRSGQPRWRQPGVSELQCTHFGGDAPQIYLCNPIVAHGNTVGVLYVQCPTAEVAATVKQSMDSVRQLVQLTGMAVATLNLRTSLENQSIRDSLTGLFNRRFMQISLERELASAARRNHMVSVFMLDLDHFKAFNDTHGHVAGDMVLKAIADIFRACIRNEDIACRYGGEEFTIILPDVTPQAAWERADAIRSAIASLRVPLEREVCADFTVSIGVAFFPHDGDDADLLLRRADSALYRAKRLGRDQVVLFETPLVSAGASASAA